MIKVNQAKFLWYGFDPFSKKEVNKMRRLSYLCVTAPILFVLLLITFFSSPTNDILNKENLAVIFVAISAIPLSIVSLYLPEIILGRINADPKINELLRSSRKEEVKLMIQERVKLQGYFSAGAYWHVLSRMDFYKEIEKMDNTEPALKAKYPNLFNNEDNKKGQP